MQLFNSTVAKNNIKRLYKHGARKMAPITYSSLQGIPLAYASCSIGCRPSDTLPRRLEAISKAGFTSIELSFPDIIDHGTHLLGSPIDPTDYDKLLTIASEIRQLCDANSLSIMMLQPFANFEGWPKGSPERKEAFTKAKGWIEIMRTVGTDLLQVCLVYYHVTASSWIISKLTRVHPNPGWSNRYTFQ